MKFDLGDGDPMSHLVLEPLDEDGSVDALAVDGGLQVVGPAQVEDALQDGLALHPHVDGVRAEVLGEEEPLVPAAAAVLVLAELVLGALELVGQHGVLGHGAHVLADGAHLGRHSVL